MRRTPVAALLATLVVPAAVFAWLGERVARGEALGWDGPAARLIDTTVPRVGVPLGAGSVLVAGALAGAAATAAVVVQAARRGHLRELSFLALSVGGMLALDPLLKAAFRRPPVSADGSGYTFPSGTAMVSLALVAALALLVRRPALRWAAVTAGGAVAVALGVAVVYLRWHYPSDVVGGWCVALGWVSLLWLALLAPPRRGARRPARREAGR
jgi:undecaprenyl-diphosphatase